MRTENVMTQMKKLVFIVFAMSAVMITSCDDEEDGDNVAKVDQDFMTNATYANRAEIELGALAVSKAADESVRMFGQMMIEDHEDALEELKDIADDRDFKLPEGLDQEHNTMKDMLEDLTGYAFDSAYMHGQVMDHEKTEALFETQTSNGRDQHLKNYANTYLPHIRMHLHHADSLATALDAEHQMDGE